jgi:hypothetical protein
MVTHLALAVLVDEVADASDVVAVIDEALQARLNCGSVLCAEFTHWSTCAPPSTEAGLPSRLQSLQATERHMPAQSAAAPGYALSLSNIGYLIFQYRK